MTQLVWKMVWCFLKKSNVELPYNPAISLLSIHPKEMKAGMYTPMFIVSLLIVAKSLTQPKCLSTVEWINKTYIQWNMMQP